MKARKGFIYTAFALLIALFLSLAAAYLLQLGSWTLKEEARMTQETERSLYPLAWSTTNYVLQSLKEVYVTGDATLPAARVFLDGNLSVGNPEPVKFTVPLPLPLGSVTDPNVYFKVTLTGGASKINVESIADVEDNYDVNVAGGLRSVTVRGALKRDASHTDGWAIIWRW